MDTFLAYTAGFIDGEGCIDIRHRKTHNGKYERYEVRMAVAQKVEEPLLLMQQKYGGSIARPKNGVARWVLVGDQLHTLLEQIKDVLIVKKDEAYKAIEFIEYAKSIGRISKTVGKGFAKHPIEVNHKKHQLMYDIRTLRIDKGLNTKTKVARNSQYA